MAYQSDKPAPNDNMKNDSVTDIRTNYADLKTAFDVNHEALTGTGLDEGKHKFLQMPQTAPPNVRQDFGILYTTEDAVAGNTTLEYRLKIPNINEFRIKRLSQGLTGTNYARTSSALLVQWGNFTMNAGSIEDTILFPTPYLARLQCINVYVNSQVAATDPDTIALITQKDLTQFTVKAWKRSAKNVEGAAQNIRVRWYALGF